MSGAQPEGFAMVMVFPRPACRGSETVVVLVVTQSGVGGKTTV
jgi:hypothetical protein